MRDFKEVIDQWPTIRAFSRDTKIHYEICRKMRTRNLIRAEYWPDVLRAARERKIKLSVEMLMRMSQRRAKDIRAAA